MSHFVGIVIGSNYKEQLEPYNEHIEVEPYITSVVSDEDKESFLKFYIERGKITDTTSFESAYNRLGQDWNGMSWRLDSSGVWNDWSTYNPKSKWDWYAIGGRWKNFFPLKNGGYSDQCKKGKVDWERKITEVFNESKAYYELVASCFPDGEIPTIPMKWEELHEEDINLKREIYRSQGAFKLLEKVQSDLFLSKEKVDAISFLSLESFQGHTVESYAKLMADQSIVPFTLVKDEVWMEKGEMGYWGISWDIKDDWNETFWKIWNEMPDDEIVTAIDFHI